MKEGCWRLVMVAAFLASTPAGAGRYPRVFSDGQSTWICTDRALVNISGDLWTFYTSADGLTSDRVRQVAADAREVWAATPRGLSRMDRSSRRWTAYFAPHPLPSDNVLSVAMDIATCGRARRRGWCATINSPANFPSSTTPAGRAASRYTTSTARG